MSDKAPVVIKNAAPHEVSFSEVTGKITRKVNRFNDGKVTEANGKEETLHEQAGETSVNAQHIEANEGNTAARLRGEAGREAGPNIQHAVDSSANDGRVHADKAKNLVTGRETPEVQSAESGLDRQHVASVEKALTANQRIDSGRSAQENVLHEPISGGQSNTVFAETAASDQNMINLPRAGETADSAQTVAVDTVVENRIHLDEHAPDNPIPSTARTGGVSPNRLHPDAAEHAQNMFSIETGADVSPNRIHPDAVSGNERNVVYVPLPGAIGAEEVEAGPAGVAPGVAPGRQSEDGDVLPQSDAAQVDPPLDEGQQHASAMKLKISAAVEQHMHAVEEETARLNRQLEKLGNQYASLEKRHK